MVVHVVPAMGQINGRWRFQIPTAPRFLNRFSWNLKYITTSRTGPRMQNFKGYVDVGGVGKWPVWRMKVSSFFRFFATPTCRICGHTPTLNRPTSHASFWPWGSKFNFIFLTHKRHYLGQKLRTTYNHGVLCAGVCPKVRPVTLDLKQWRKSRGGQGDTSLPQKCRMGDGNASCPQIWRRFVA